MNRIEVDILVKILRNTEKIMATFAEVKAGMDALVGAIEAFIARFESGEIVSAADMQAAIDEMKAEVAKIQAVP